MARQWSRDENEYLIQHYGHTPLDKMMQVLGRSRKAVWGHASVLGIATGKGPQLTIVEAGDICLVPLHSDKYHGLVATIDTVDRPLIELYRWSPNKGRYTFYAWACVDGRMTMMHSLLCKTREPMDHKDGNGLNNRRSNLRPASRSQNRANARKSAGRSRYRGVSKIKRRPAWRVKVGSRWCGYFHDEVEAARHYDKVAKDMFGEYARLNFPEDTADATGT